MLKNQLEKYLVGSSSLCFGPITAPSETTIAGKSLENRFANVLYQKYSRSSSGAAGLQEGYEACELALQAVCLKALASPEDIQSVVVQLVAGVERLLALVSCPSLPCQHLSFLFLVSSKGLPSPPSPLIRVFVVVTDVCVHSLWCLPCMCMGFLFFAHVFVCCCPPFLQ